MPSWVLLHDFQSISLLRARRIYLARDMKRMRSLALRHQSPKLCNCLKYFCAAACTRVVYYTSVCLPSWKRKVDEDSKISMWSSNLVSYRGQNCRLWPRGPAVYADKRLLPFFRFDSYPFFSDEFIHRFTDVSLWWGQTCCWHSLQSESVV